LEQYTDQFVEYANVAIGYFRHPEFLIQLGLVIVLFLPAWLISTRVEPVLEERVRKVSGMPTLLRVLAALLRRLEWLFYIIFLGIAYVTTSAIAWPESNHFLYSVMLLSAAWLLINVATRVIRSKFLAKVLAIVVWTFVAATVLGVANEVAAALDRIGFNVGSMRLSVLRIMQAIVFISALMWLAFSAGNFVDRRLQKVEELTPSLRVLLGKMLRIAFIVLAVMIGMQSLSIDLTALTVLSGAVGVGIGFGLQKVVSNFISGIIILLDQSIKPGDTITLGDTFGWIRELRARFVSVVTRDGREYLIPNEDFITTQVVNWSFSDKFVRLDVPFGVSYDSDPHEVIRLAKEAAASVDRVDDSQKPPVCWMTEFGDSSIKFVLRFWIDDPQGGLTNIRGKVLIALWDILKENDIRIPYPHREVILRTPPPVVE
jgi:small-conductance mechanosensitive channel